MSLDTPDPGLRVIQPHIAPPGQTEFAQPFIAQIFQRGAAGVHLLLGVKDRQQVDHRFGRQPGD
jgi:hypothetical protein